MNLRSRLEKLENGKSIGLVVVFPTELSSRPKNAGAGNIPGRSLIACCRSCWWIRRPGPTSTTSERTDDG